MQSTGWIEHPTVTNRHKPGMRKVATLLYRPLVIRLGSTAAFKFNFAALVSDDGLWVAHMILIQTAQPIRAIHKVIVTGHYEFIGGLCEGMDQLAMRASEVNVGNSKN